MKTTNRQVVYLIISITIALGNISYARFAYAEAVKWNLNNTGNIGPGYTNLQTVSGSSAKPTTTTTTSGSTINGTIPVWKLVINPTTGKPYDSFLEYIQTSSNGVNWSASKQTTLENSLNTELVSSDTPATKDEVLNLTKHLPISEQNAWLMLALSFGLSIPALQRMLTKVGTSASVNPNEAKVLANTNAAKLMSLIENNGGYASLGITRDQYINLVVHGSANFTDFINPDFSTNGAITLKGIERYLSASSRTAEEKQAILLKVITGKLTYSPDLQSLANLNLSAPHAQATVSSLEGSIANMITQRYNFTMPEVVSRMKTELAPQVVNAQRLSTPALNTVKSATATKTQTDILSAVAAIAASALQTTKSSGISSADYLTSAETIGSKISPQTAYAPALEKLIGTDTYAKLGTASSMLLYMYRLADLGSTAPDFDLKGRGADSDLAVIKPLLDTYRTGLLAKDSTTWKNFTNELLTSVTSISVTKPTSAIQSVASTVQGSIQLPPLTKADLPNEKYVQLYDIYKSLNLGLTEEQLVSLLLSNTYLKQANLFDYFLSAAKFLTDKTPHVQYYIGGSALPFLTTFLLDQQNTEGFVNHLANMGGALYSAEKQGISYSWNHYTNNYFNNLNLSSEAANKRINNGNTTISSLIKLAEDKATSIKTDIAQNKLKTQTPTPALVIPTNPQSTSTTQPIQVTTTYDLAALEKQIASLIAQQQAFTLKAQVIDVEITDLNKTLSTSQVDLNKLLAYNSNTNAFQGGVSIPAGAQLFFKSTTPFNGYNTNTVFGVFADGSITAYSNQTELNKDMALSNEKTIKTITTTEAQNRINQYKSQFNQLVEVQKQKDAAEKAKNQTEIDRLNAYITSINLTLQQKQQENNTLKLQVSAAASEVVIAQQKKTFITAAPKNSTVQTSTITSTTQRQDLITQGYMEAFVYDIATAKSSYKYEKLSVITVPNQPVAIPVRKPGMIYSTQNSTQDYYSLGYTPVNDWMIKDIQTKYPNLFDLKTITYTEKQIPSTPTGTSGVPFPTGRTITETYMVPKYSDFVSVKSDIENGQNEILNYFYKINPEIQNYLRLNPNPEIQKASSNLQSLLTDKIYFDLAAESYNPNDLQKNTVPGWKKITSDTELAKYGIKYKDLCPAEEYLSGFHAVLFENTTTKELCLAFEGSDSEVLGALNGNVESGDWYNNLRQARGGIAPFYDQAAYLAKNINTAVMKQNPTTKLTFTGHSLGGGLATLAATITSKEAYVINPAYLSESTLKYYGKSVADVESNTKLHHYYVEGELLNYAQHIDTLKKVSGVVLAEPNKENEIILKPTNNEGKYVNNGLYDRMQKHLKDVIYPSWYQTIADKVNDLAITLQKGGGK